MKKQLVFMITLVGGIAQNATAMQECPVDPIGLQTNLMHALKNRFYTSASTLINARTPINDVIIGQLKNHEVSEALFEAAVKEGHIRTLNVLIAHNAFPKELAQQRFKVFSRTFAKNKLNRKSLLTLLYSNAINALDLNALQEIGDYIEITPLGYAANKGDFEVVRALLNAPAINPNKQNEDGYTPLMLAIQSNTMDLNTLQALLNNPDIKKELEIKNNRGDTAFALAVLIGILSDLILELISLGVNINTQNNLGQTPLMFAILQHADETLIRLLIENKANLTIKDNKGKTAYDYAKASKYPDVRALAKLLN